MGLSSARGNRAGVSELQRNLWNCTELDASLISSLAGLVTLKWTVLLWDPTFISIKRRESRSWRILWSGIPERHTQSALAQWALHWHRLSSLCSPVGGSAPAGKRRKTNRVPNPVSRLSLEDGSSDRHCVWPPLTVVLIAQSNWVSLWFNWAASLKAVIKQTYWRAGWHLYGPEAFSCSFCLGSNLSERVDLI